MKCTFDLENRLEIIAAYAPPAMTKNKEGTTVPTDAAKKDNFYEELQKCVNECPIRHDKIILGDMNARIEKAITEEEQMYIGMHTFSPHTANPHAQTPNVWESRTMFIGFLIANNIHVMNTQFQKRDKFIATRRQLGKELEEHPTRPDHEQYDYILTENRWKTHSKRFRGRNDRPRLRSLSSKGGHRDQIQSHAQAKQPNKEKMATK